MTWPDDTMEGNYECSQYYETNVRIFATRTECETQAQIKLEETVQRFVEMKVDFESIEVGCEEIKK
jgi:hypothetical protein